jgi:hypothetical protein
MKLGLDVKLGLGMKLGLQLEYGVQEEFLGPVHEVGLLPVIDIVLHA